MNLFEPTGFQVLSGVLSEEEVDRADNVWSIRGVSRTAAGVRHLLGIPAVSAIAKDARLIGIAGACLGHEPVAFRATLFNKSRHSNWTVPWHQDRSLPMQKRFELPGWGPWSVKAGVLFAHAPASTLANVVALRLYLDDSTATNGPLRVIPGSHKLGLLTHEAIRDLVSSEQSIDCLTRKGGVVAMRPLLVHSSPKALAASPRRVLHVEYAAATDLGRGIRLAIA